MKKWLKVSIISLLLTGVVSTAGHFIGVDVAKDIRLSKITETFVSKVESTKNYKIKHLNLSLFDTQTSHNLDLKFTNLELHLGKNDSYNFKGDVKCYYDFLEIYSGSAVFLDDIFYLQTYESMLVKENISFKGDSLETFKNSFNNSTLVDAPLFDFSLDLNIFEKFSEQVKEIKNEDPSTFVFEYPVKKYNSSIIFYSDEDCNIKKIKSQTALEIENTLLTLDASNIEYSEKSSLRESDVRPWINAPNTAESNKSLPFLFIDG